MNNQPDYGACARITGFIVVMLVAVLVGIVISSCRLGTPTFNTGSQTNSGGEVWTNK